MSWSPSEPHGDGSITCLRADNIGLKAKIRYLNFLINIRCVSSREKVLDAIPDFDELSQEERPWEGLSVETFLSGDRAIEILGGRLELNLGVAASMAAELPADPEEMKVNIRLSKSIPKHLDAGRGVADIGPGFGGNDAEERGEQEDAAEEAEGEGENEQEVDGRGGGAHAADRGDEGDEADLEGGAARPG